MKTASTRAQTAPPAASASQPRQSPRTAAGGVAKRHLYRRLLADVLQGRLAPNSPLCLRDLARDCGTSTTSVRQVLIGLVRDRVVVSCVSGFAVAPTRQTELLELTQTAYWLGEVGLRESIRRGDQQWEENLLRTCRGIELASEPSLSGADRTPPTWEQMLAFYDALAAGCHSSILTDQYRSLNERLLRYRNLAAVASGRDHQDRSCASPLRDAALARNAERASELLLAHYRVTEHGILASGILT